MRPLDDAPGPGELLPDLLADTWDRTDRAEVTDALDAIDGALTNNIRPLTGAAAMSEHGDEVGRLRTSLARVREVLDEWEASYGISTLPQHWGITSRISDLRAAVGDESRALTHRQLHAEAIADAIEGAMHIVDCTDDAEALARLADQWRKEIPA